MGDSKTYIVLVEQTYKHRVELEVRADSKKTAIEVATEKAKDEFSEWDPPDIVDCDCSIVEIIS